MKRLSMRHIDTIQAQPVLDLGEPGCDAGATPVRNAREDATAVVSRVACVAPDDGPTVVELWCAQGPASASVTPARVLHWRRTLAAFHVAARPAGAGFRGRP